MLVTPTSADINSKCRSGRTTWTRPGEERPGSVGRALPGQQIKAVTTGADGSWADCGPGQTGVLVIGGPAVFAGYVTDPALGGPRVSRDGVVRDGWLDTGDLGRVDADGFVYLTGRAKDLIIRGGHNIDPIAIEEVLFQHPAVAFAAVPQSDEARLVGSLAEANVGNQPGALGRLVAKHTDGLSRSYGDDHGITAGLQGFLGNEQDEGIILDEQQDGLFHATDP